MMIEPLITKLVALVSEPAILILLLWVAYLIKDKKDIININQRLLDAQQERGIALARIITMIESLLRKKED